MSIELIVLIVVVLLLIGAFGPRAGWYGTPSRGYDIFGVVLFIIVVFVLLRLLGIV